MTQSRELVHATAIAVGDRAALIRGPSGAGKSDLALRCIAGPTSELLPTPAHLIADDQVILERIGHRLCATAPSTLLGKLEVRGLGILEVRTVASGWVTLVIDLVEANEIERLPRPWPETELVGVSVPVVRVNPRESSAAIKVLLALRGSPPT
jgi:HPr kinase/phosphorylase